ncbi:TPA: hypothetical protein DDW35_08435, partial [Candidatus Sumerlaeota bacterium]|nr:hypothetical protein [Candidatus Sumerlaeota bacterium]
AHDQGIVHRDIKPGNIMVTRDPNGKLQVFLMDFGIATAIRESMNSSSLMSMLQPQQGSSPGTPAYMAPEQIDRNNFGPLDHRADLYAFGVTLFQMLTLQMPFDSAISAYDAHLYLQPRDPSELPTALRQILKKALQKKASDRYQNAAEFRNDLETFIGTAPLAQPTAQVVDTAQPAPHVSDTNTVLVTSRTPPPRQKRTNKLLIGVVLCLLVGLCTLACAGWYFVHHIPGWFTATNSQPQTALGASTAAPSTSPAQVIPAPSPAAISVTPAPATPLTQESVVAPLDTPTAIPAPEKITSALPPTPTPTPAVPLIQESIVAPQSTPPIATPSPEKTPVLTPTPTPVLTPKSRRTPIPEEEDAPVKQVKPKPTQMPSKLTNTFKWSSDRP